MVNSRCHYDLCHACLQYGILNLSPESEEKMSACTWDHYVNVDKLIYMYISLIGDCNIPGNAILDYDIKFVGIYSGNRALPTNR